MERPGAAERDERVFARVDALGHRVGANLERHVGVDHPDDAERRLFDAHVELAAEIAFDRFGRERGIDGDAATEELLGIEPPEHHLRVGHRGFRAALAVACRPRVGSGRARANAERTTFIDIGNGAAAGTDRRQVDHRRQNGIAADIGVARVHDAHFAARHDADIGRGTADIDSDQILNAGEIAGPFAADHTAGRPRHEDRHRPLAATLDGGDAAIRLHQEASLRDEAGTVESVG